MKTIAIASQKGGVGKSTSALALLSGLKKEGFKTLAIDLDPQRNLSLTLQADFTAPSITEVFSGESVFHAIQDTALGALIPASSFLASDKPKATDALKQALKPLASFYDYCIIDCAPSLDILSVNALAAADYCLVPTRADRYSAEGFTELMKTVQAVKKVNPGLHLLGLLVTQFNPRTSINSLVLEELNSLAAENGTKVFSPFIRKCVTLEELQYTADLFEYAPNSNAAKDYRAITEQIIIETKG